MDYDIVFIYALKLGKVDIFLRLRNNFIYPFFLHCLNDGINRLNTGTGATAPIFMYSVNKHIYILDVT